MNVVYLKHLPILGTLVNLVSLLIHRNHRIVTPMPQMRKQEHSISAVNFRLWNRNNHQKCEHAIRTNTHKQYNTGYCPLAVYNISDVTKYCVLQNGELHHVIQ